MLKFEFTLLTAAIISHSIILTLFTLIGGVLSILIFTQLGVDIEKWINTKFSRKFKHFSWKNRMLVKLRKKWGIVGISILSPILLSLPIGILLCLTLTTDKMMIIKPMIYSVIFWTFIFYIIGILIRL